MTRAIGFRVEPTAVHFAVVEGTVERPVLVDCGRYAAPVGFEEAASLTWYRARTKTTIEAHQPDRAMIKYMESVSRAGGAASGRRHRIEGVVLQLVGELDISVTTGPFATVSAKLGSNAKAFLATDDLRGLDWSSRPKLAREAILAASAGLEGE